jgi:hypothetical protein
MCNNGSVGIIMTAALEVFHGLPTLHLVSEAEASATAHRPSGIGMWTAEDWTWDLLGSTPA